MPSYCACSLVWSLENSSFLPYGKAELGLLNELSQLVFSLGEYVQKGACLGLGRAVVTPEPSKGWFGLNVDLSVPASSEDLLSQRDALVMSRV